MGVCLLCVFTKTDPSQPFGQIESSQIYFFSFFGFWNWDLIDLAPFRPFPGPWSWTSRKTNAGQFFEIKLDPLPRKSSDVLHCRDCGEIDSLTCGIVFVFVFKFVFVCVFRGPKNYLQWYCRDCGEIDRKVVDSLTRGIVFVFKFVFVFVCVFRGEIDRKVVWQLDMWNWKSFSITLRWEMVLGRFTGQSLFLCELREQIKQQCTQWL